MFKNTLGLGKNFFDRYNFDMKVSWVGCGGICNFAIFNMAAFKTEMIVIKTCTFLDKNSVQMTTNLKIWELLLIKMKQTYRNLEKDSSGLAFLNCKNSRIFLRFVMYKTFIQWNDWIWLTLMYIVVVLSD